MALYCQNMLEIAVELALTDPEYEDMALKFCEHFLWIASAMAHLGQDTGMWDEEDGFFYDVLRLPNGQDQRLKVRSMVGLLPLCAATIFEGELMAKSPELEERFRWFLADRPELYAAIHDPTKPGVAGRRLASILDETKLRRVLAKMLDEDEFLSPFGIRSLSRHHADHPYVIHAGGQEYRVSYLPAESDSGMFGGNSNWRGPDLDAGQRPDYPGAAPVSPLLRRRLHGRVPDRFRPGDDPLSGGRGDRAAAREHLPEGQGWPSSGLWRQPGRSRTTRTGAIASCSTSISTAITAPASVPATRPAGRVSSPGPCTSSRP